MNLRDWYLRQVVSESELDAALSDVQQADLNLAKDWDLAALDSFASPFPDEIDGGIITGLVSSLGTYPNVATTAGTAYDSAGLRVRTGATYSVDITRQGQTAVGAGGQPTGADTDPGAGNERWVSLFILFDRALSDPRVDGNNNTVYFKRDESFRFEVVVGTAKAAGTLVAADKPAMVSGKILLADLKVSSTGFVAGSLDTTRRQDWFVRTSGASPAFSRTAAAIRLGSPRLVIEELLAQFDDHVTNTVATPGPHGRNTPFAQHAATAIAYAGSATWADGVSAISATTVEAAIDEIVTDLKATTAPAGAKLIGALLQAGTAATTGVVSLTAGTLESQITALLDGINSRVLRTGDTIAGNLLPDATASNRTLGNAGAKWDAVLETLGVDLVSSNVVPTASGLDLGSAGARWDAFLQAVDLTGNVTPAAGTRWAGVLIPDVSGRALGAVATPWTWGGNLVADAGDRLLGSATFPWQLLASTIALDSSTASGDIVSLVMKAAARTVVKTKDAASSGTQGIDSPAFALLGSGWTGTIPQDTGLEALVDVTNSTDHETLLFRREGATRLSLIGISRAGEIVAKQSSATIGASAFPWTFGYFRTVSATTSAAAMAAISVTGATGANASTVALARLLGEVKTDVSYTYGLLHVTNTGANATAPAAYFEADNNVPALRLAAGGNLTTTPVLALYDREDGIGFDGANDALLVFSNGTLAPASSKVKVGGAQLTSQPATTADPGTDVVHQTSAIRAWADISTSASGFNPVANVGLNVGSLVGKKDEVNNWVDVPFVRNFSGDEQAFVVQAIGADLRAEIVQVLVSGANTSGVRVRLVDDAGAVLDVDGRRFTILGLGRLV